VGTIAVDRVTVSDMSDVSNRGSTDHAQARIDDKYEAEEQNRKIYRDGHSPIFLW